MKRTRISTASIGLVALWTVAPPAARAGAEGPKPAAAPAMPADLVRRIGEVTDVVLEHHIDPPARQQMVLSGIRALYRAAGSNAPPDLGRRVSAAATPDQLAAIVRESWPRTTATPATARALEDALFRGLVAAVPGRAEVMTEKEHKVTEQYAGNRYVGIHVALSWYAGEERPKFQAVLPGGPADRAGIKPDELLDEVEGVDTRGSNLRDVIDRLRGDEGTDVTIKVRGPKDAKARTITLTRGQLPRATIQGARKGTSGEWTFRLDAPDPVGYLKITEIAASTPHELRKLARQMEDEGARALVLDLRGAGMTALTTAVHPAVLVADSLLEGGAIGRVRAPGGETTYRADPDALFRGWPIAVLVDRGTAGTAEWVAAALQDNHRAVLVGRPTRGAPRPAPVFGRPGAVDPDDFPNPFEGTIRSAVPLGDGRGAVVMLTGHLDRGDGRPLADYEDLVLGSVLNGERPGFGVRPDHLLPNPGVRHAPGRTPERRTSSLDDPGESPGSPDDPAIAAALKVLHPLLEKR